MPTTTARVKVTETAAPDHTIQIEVHPDPISLKNLSPNGEAVDIEWHFDPSSSKGWKFTADGITLSSSDPDKRFSHVATADQKSTWRRKQGGMDGKHYKYNIKATNGNTTVIVDPGIINES